MIPGVVDTGNKFIVDVLDTAGKYSFLNIIIRKFLLKIKTVLLGYLGTRGKLIHKKNLKLKILCHTPTKGLQIQNQWKGEGKGKEKQPQLYLYGLQQAFFIERDLRSIRDT